MDELLRRASAITRSGYRDERAGRRRPVAPGCDDDAVSDAPATAVLSLRPRYSTERPELEGTVSTAKRRRLFTNLADALSWARSRADIVEVHVDDAVWSAGELPTSAVRARALDPVAERRVAASIEEEFQRDRDERRRYAEPCSWYLAFWVDPGFPVDTAARALEEVERVNEVVVRLARNDRRIVIVHLQARSRDEVLRRGESDIREALVALQRTEPLPGFTGAGLGHHEIGLTAHEHRNETIQGR